MAVATQAEVAFSDECQKEDKDSSKRNDLVSVFVLYIFLIQLPSLKEKITF